MILVVQAVLPQAIVSLLVHSLSALSSTKATGPEIGVVSSGGSDRITFTTNIEVSLANTDQLYTSQVYLYWMDM